MNAEDRRAMKPRAVARLKKTKGYILITFDGKTLPVYQFDLSKFNDQGDMRHVVMRNIADNVARDIDNLQEYGKIRVRELAQEEKAEKFKAERSAKLAEFDDSIPGERTFQNAEVKVDAAA